MHRCRSRKRTAPKQTPVSEQANSSFGHSKLQPTGEEPVSKPVIKQARGREVTFFTNSEQKEAAEIRDYIKRGGKINVSGVKPRILDCLILNEMLSAEEITAHGLRV
jgi:hypothetical protein